LNELINKLAAVRDANGEVVIRGVYRSDQIYTGNATAFAPDLIIGYKRAIAPPGKTVLGDLTDEARSPVMH